MMTSKGVTIIAERALDIVAAAIRVVKGISDEEAASLDPIASDFICLQRVSRRRIYIQNGIEETEPFIPFPSQNLPSRSFIVPVYT